jgi:hypothetical protein
MRSFPSPPFSSPMPTMLKQPYRPRRLGVPQKGPQEIGAGWETQ